MDVINTSNTLQCYPVFEPENVILSFTCAIDCIQLNSKSVIDKLLYQVPGVVSDIASARVSLDRCLDPDTDVNDAFGQSFLRILKSSWTLNGTGSRNSNFGGSPVVEDGNGVQCKRC
jgi:hypothetical protein